jgi:hypothetical protein
MVTDALISLTVIILLACLFYGPWQWVCADIARQFLFEKRARIFDIAREGRLSFGSNEYRTIRLSLEASIRFAHEFTWPRFFLLRQALARRGMLARKSNLSVAIEKIADEKTRQEIEWLVFRAHAAIVLTTFLRSPVLLLGLPVAVVLVVAIYFLQRVRDWVKRLILETAEIMQVEAENVR